MNINAIPIIGWIISAIVSISMAIPFWFFWTVCDIGKIYFPFLPENYQTISLWHCIGLFVVISILKTVVIPKLADVTQKVESKK